MYKLTLPTVLTWVRLILVPFFVIVYYIPDSLLAMQQKNFLASIIFMIAAITDYFDGYLARKLKQESSFGAFLDPVADKALVASALILLIHLDRTFVVAGIVIIIREIAVSALREWMAQLGSVKNTAVAYIGKLKTTLQFIAIILLLLDYHTNLIGNILMALAVIFTVVSMIYYLKQAQKHFQEVS